ncbi:MAG: thioredoxin family protein [Lentisphaeraceae bacterium]|nr:thioredoxin family protein [Lentisphaeraceae bacterium]
METFIQSMGFLMMLAVVWLFEALQALIAEGDMLFPIFWAFTFFAVALWVYGKYTPLYLAKSTRIKGLVASLLIAAASLYYGYSKIDEKSSILWEVVEAQNLQETLDQAIAQGQPVFVDFTAKWCATCQVNKSIAIAPNAALLDKKGVLMVKVDNTKKSPAVSPWLKKFESPGVPLNLLYDGKEDSLPIKFPESYTSGLMQEQLHKLPDSSK